MQAANLTAFQTYLVEDVLLTLGNLRAALTWLTEDGTVGPGDGRHAGLARIDRQIELLQVRARAACIIDPPSPGDPEAGRTTTIETMPGRAPAGPSRPPLADTGAGLERLLRDALGPDTAAAPPMFRSRRADQD